MNYQLINSSTNFDVVVLAGGDYPQHAVPTQILQQAPRIVCCDSAIELLHPSLYNKVEAVVGDGDSMSDAAKRQFHDVLYVEHEQADNDLTKATRYCVSRNYCSIAYLGATGKREDHTLGNISLLLRYFQTYGVQPVMVTDYGTFVPCHGDCTFESFAKQQVSIFNFSCQRIESEGLRWPSHAYQSWWEGTLNEAEGESFSIQSDGDYLVYRTHEAKTAMH